MRGARVRQLFVALFILLFSALPVLGDDEDEKAIKSNPKSEVSAYLERKLGMPPAESNSFLEALKATRPSGHFRIYNFNRQNNNNDGVNIRSLAAGGEIRLTTGSYKGFSMGFWWYTIRSIGVYEPDIQQETLVGPSHNLNTLAVAYMQFRKEHVLLVGGRHTIDTPWARHDFYTMLPRSFTGATLTIRPLPWDKIRPADYMEPEGAVETFPEAKFSERLSRYGLALPRPVLENPPGTDFKHSSLKLVVSRIFQRESRFRDHFNEGNRYTDKYTPGFITGGLEYFHPVDRHLFFSRDYFYKFYDYALLWHTELGYRYDVHPAFKAFLGFEYVGQVNDGFSAFGPVRADVFGWQAGFLFPNGNFKFVANFSPPRHNTFRHGGMVHPYSDLSYTNFSDTMNDGIENLGPSNALGVRLAYSLFDKSLDLSVSWVRYRVKYGFSGAAYDTNGSFGFPRGTPIPNQVQWALDPSVAYHFKGKLKGLHLVEDVGLRVSADAPHGALLENRFRLIYEF